MATEAPTAEASISVPGLYDDLSAPPGVAPPAAAAAAAAAAAPAAAAAAPVPAVSTNAAAASAAPTDASAAAPALPAAKAIPTFGEYDTASPAVPNAAAATAATPAAAAAATPQVSATSLPAPPGVQYYTVNGQTYAAVAPTAYAAAPTAAAAAPAAPAAAAQPPPQQSYAGAATVPKLFVGGLGWSTTEQQFHEFFSRFGPVVESTLLRDKHTGQSRGYGFVVFRDAACVDMCLNKSFELDGRRIDVKLASQKATTQSAGAGAGAGTGAVAPPPPQPPQHSYGPGVLPPAPGQRYGYGPPSARPNLNQLPPGQREVPSGPISMEPRTKKMFVGGLAMETTTEDLRIYFEKFGVINEAQVMTDHLSNRSRGFGFVTFELEESVDAVQLAGKHVLHGKQIDPKRAMPRGQAPPALRPRTLGAGGDDSGRSRPSHDSRDSYDRRPPDYDRKEHYASVEPVAPPAQPVAAPAVQYAYVTAPGAPAGVQYVVAAPSAAGGPPTYYAATPVTPQAPAGYYYAAAPAGLQYATTATAPAPAVQQQQADDYAQAGSYGAYAAAKGPRAGYHPYR